MMAGSFPVNARRAARQVHADIGVQELALASHGDGGACARAARQRLSGSPFMNAQANMPPVHDLHESHIGAL